MNPRLAALWVVLSATPAWSATDPPCPADSEDEAECLVRWARSGGDHAAAGRRLEARLEDVAEPAGGPLALAEVALAAGQFEQLPDIASGAVRRCLFSADQACELRARHLMAYGLSQTNRLDLAIWEAEKAYLMAAQAESERDRYRIGLMLARLRLSGLADLGRVERLLDEIEPLAGEADSRDRRYALSTRAHLLKHLGYLDQAALAFARARDLARADGDPVMSASEEFNRIDSLFESGSLGASTSQRAAAVSALEALVDGSQTPVATRLHALALLAQIDPGQAPMRLRVCLEIATGNDDPRSIARCAAELAMSNLGAAGAQAETAAELIGTARRGAQRSSNPNAELELTRAEMALSWETEPPEPALAKSLSLLAAEARRRNRQASPARQREFLAFLNEDHYWLAARIAAGVADGTLPAGRLERAIALLESVRGGAGARTDPVVAVEQRLSDWWNTAADLRRVGGPASDVQARSAFRELEAMPAAFLATVQPSWTGVVDLDFDAVRRELKPAQAIVYYQWLPRGGDQSSWVHVLSADTIATRALANPGSIELAMALLHSGVRRVHAAEFERALNQLYDHILAPVLEDLPGVERLIVVPDAALFSVPMQALARIAPNLDQIEIYPSIGAWMDHGRMRDDSGSVWMFANPVVPRAQAAVAGRAPVLEELPGAEREAAAVRALLGNRVRVSHGLDATESNALTALTSRAGVVHFATHAVLNATNPQASAIVLAPDPAHDGWLTLAQIAALEIPPKLIVLSACEAASGRMLTGEGLIGLSAGFLRAGARAVLANLWPIDDRHAAVFIERVYARLDAGRPLERARSEAADELAAAGYPATAWAGWTIIGDGESMLAPPPRRWPWALALGIALLLLAAHAAHRRRA